MWLAGMEERTQDEKQGTHSRHGRRKAKIRRDISDYGISGKALSIDFRSSSGGSIGANKNKMAPTKTLQSRWSEA